jgi:Tol biopolymer transport system component/DNA-binding winged helix-turn-helix (wHTH) protein
MAAVSENSQNWRFGAFEVERRTAELRRNGVAIRLQEQPSQLLLYLLEHAGEIVTREDLRAQLWPADTFVDFDHALNTAVMKLREALGDSSEKPLYIQTLPRKGYRFVAPVSALPATNGRGAALSRAEELGVEDAAPSSTNGNNREAISGEPTSADTTPKMVRAVPPLAGAGDSSADLRGRNADEPRTHLSQAAIPRIAVIRIAVMLGAAILLAAAVFLYLRPKPVIAPARSLTRITFDEGLQSDPTWSPDGRYIAYSANRGGTTNIWMQQTSVGDPVQITTGPGPNWQPDWSPDGRYIAYRSDAGENGLFVIPALGGAGQERRIATFGYNPRWSPDGSQILFQRQSVSWPDNSKFYVVGLDGGPPRRVFDEFFRQHSSFYAKSAAWHPDGKRVTIWVRERAVPNPNPAFWTLPLDGGTPVQSEFTPQIRQRFTELAVRIGYERGDDSKFVWAPSGDALYLERTFRGARSLWRLNIDPRTLRATGIEQLTAGAGINSAPAISPDGKRLAFTAASAETSAWLYPLDADKGSITGPGTSATSPGVDAWMPTLTRDGSKLAFSGVRAGETRLWVKSLPDGRELPLFVDSYNRNNAQWSPDGTRLAYLRQLRDRVPEMISMWSAAQIMVWSAQSRQEEAVTSLSTRRSAKEPLVAQFLFDWSPDGRSLLVSKTFDLQDVTVWQVPISAAPHAELQEREIIAKPGFQIWQPYFSPDGQWIAFEATSLQDPSGQTEGRSSLYVMRATGGPWIPIVNDSNCVDKPRWSPDGKTIYFLFLPSGGSFFNVWAVHFNPETGKAVGKPFQVTSLDSPSRMIPRDMAHVEISVSQKSLVTTLEQVSGGIWVLDNVDR